jgi:hypothetical protein
MSEEFKSTFFKEIQAILSAKESSLNEALRELREGMSAEGKSTAGDKHDTSIAMAQIECERLEKQLSEVREQITSLSRLRSSESTDIRIINGSIFRTNVGYFFMGLPLGKLSVDAIEITALTQQSPLGSRFYTKEKGDRIVFNNKEFIIEIIL